MSNPMIEHGFTLGDYVTVIGTKDQEERNRWSGILVTVHMENGRAWGTIENSEWCIDDHTVPLHTIRKWED